MQTARLFADVRRSSRITAPWKGLNLRWCRSAVAALALMLSMTSVADALPIALQWDRNNDGVTTGYRVYYRTGSGTYQPASGLDVGNVTQFQADLQPGQTYYFAVRAYSSTGELGPSSTELNFTVPTGTACTGFAISQASANATDAPGSVGVSVVGSPAGCAGGNWVASGNGSWLSVSPSSGGGSGAVTVSWTRNTSSSRTATISIAGRNFTVNQTGSPTPLPAGPPFGSFDTPAMGARVAGSIAVTGWALDDVGVERVELWRDVVAGETTAPYPGPGLGTGKIFIANAFFVSGARPDIATLYAIFPRAARAGWGYLLLTHGLWNQGNGAFTLHAFAYDQEGRGTALGSKAITVSNATADKPFGGIDVPAYGQTMTGSFFNFGWSLTPSASTCTIGAGGVQVAIDSGPLLPVSYGDARPDIAGAFPGYSNGSGAGGAYYLDTTTLTNGTHQIGWYVTDSCGRAEGIGSRFFTVMNGGQAATDSGPSAAIMRDSVPTSDGNPRSAVEVWRDSGKIAVSPNPTNAHVVPVGQAERIEVHLPAVDGVTYSGYQMLAGERGELPLGSSLDSARGIFYWQPAAGFLGAHDLEFLPSNGARVVRVRAVVGTSVQSAIDTPRSGKVASVFTVAGWAIDEASPSGSGIDAVHVWAYPAAGGAPVFLGAADHGDARPDVGALFGDQFTGASYSLPVHDLQSGTYDIVVYPHSVVTGDFHGAKVIRVTVP